MVRPDGLILSDYGNYRAAVRWQEYLGRNHRINLNWNGKNLLMDVPAGAMGERILYTGDEVAFYINEKEAVKIGDTKVKPSF